MDADRFDTLTRALTGSGSRRDALAATLGGALGVLGLAAPDDAAAARSAKCKPRCGECERCKRGDCKQTKHGKKRCNPGKCKAKAFGTPCSVGTCQNGSCIAPTAAPTPISPPPPTSPPPVEPPPLTCPPGFTVCDGVCRNLNVEKANCGACGRVCPGANQACCSGVCQNLNRDRSISPRALPFPQSSPLAILQPCALATR